MVDLGRMDGRHDSRAQVVSRLDDDLDPTEMNGRAVAHVLDPDSVPQRTTQRHHFTGVLDEYARVDELPRLRTPSDKRRNAGPSDDGTCIGTVPDKPLSESLLAVPPAPRIRHADFDSAVGLPPPAGGQFW